MSNTLHLGKRNRKRLLVAQEQLRSALRLVDSIAEGEPWFPCSTLNDAIRASDCAYEHLNAIKDNRDEGLTEKQKRENPTHL